MESFMQGNVKYPISLRMRIWMEIYHIIHNRIIPSSGFPGLETQTRWGFYPAAFVPSLMMKSSLYVTYPKFKAVSSKTVLQYKDVTVGGGRCLKVQTVLTLCIIHRTSLFSFLARILSMARMEITCSPIPKAFSSSWSALTSAGLSFYTELCEAMRP